MGPDLLGPSHRRLGLDHRVTLDRVCRVSGREQLDRFRDLRQEQHVGHHDPLSHLRAPVAAPVHYRLSAHGETAASYGVLYDCHTFFTALPYIDVKGLQTTSKTSVRWIATNISASLPSSA